MESMGSRALKRKYGTKEAAAMQQPKGRDPSLNLSDILKMAAPSRTAQRASREMYFSERHPFNEPPSSTGSHATITSSSLASSATFSLGPDAESTRLDTYKAGRHRVQRSTGRFSRAGDILENVANTSALQRTFPEWHTNHTNLSTRDVDFDVASPMEDNKENQPPPARDAKRAHGTELAIRSSTRQQNRVGLRATVQNESDASTVLSKTPFEALIASSPSPLTPVRQTPRSAAAAAVRDQAQATTHSFIVPTSQSFPTLHALASGALKLTPGCKPTSLFYQSRRLSGPSHMQLPEDEAKIFVSLDKVREEVRSLQEHDEMLQKEADSLQQKVDGLRKEAHQLQAELDARDGGAYSLPLRKSTDSAIGSESDQSVNGRIYLEKQKFETEIISLRSRLDAANQRLRDQAESLSAERDAATKMAASATDKSRKLQADLESARLQLDAADQDNKALEASSDEYYNEVIRLQSVHSKDERRIRELEQQVLQRDRVIQALQNSNGKPPHNHRQEIQDLQEEVARLQAENKSLSVENASLKKEKKLLRVQNDALVERDEFLEQEVLSLRQTTDKAKTASREHVEVQSSQFHRVSVLLKEREQRLEQLEQGNQKLRQKQSDTEIQLGRAYEILHYWPGGLPEEYLDVLKKGRPMPTGPVLSQHDAAKTTEKAQAEDETEEVAPSENPLDEDDALSVDENMTSAFIVPDITINTNKEVTVTQTVPIHPVDDCQVVDTEVVSVESDNESVHGGRAPSPVRGQRRKSATSRTSTARHVVFSEVTIERMASADAKSGGNTVPTLSQEARRVLNNLCEHRCDNCSICSRIQSHAKHGACTTTITTTTTTEGKGLKKMIRIPRPLPASERLIDATGEYADEPTTRPARPPQEALARVLKGLEDEVEHLQIERNAKCNEYFRLDKAVGNRRCTAAEAHVSYLSGMISLKRKQIYDLYDVLEGQKAAGQLMTQDEVDMTIASILHQGV